MDRLPPCFEQVDALELATRITGIEQEQRPRWKNYNC